MTRALEVHAITGQAISSLQKEWSSGEHRHAAKWIGLSWEREVLNRRINTRTKQMIDAGWLEEARALRQLGVSKAAAEATGYRELFDVIDGRLTLEDALEAIKIATRQLARRQMKWLRRFANVAWLDGSLDLSALREQVAAAS